MSEASFDNAVANAGEIETQASRWLERRHFGKWDEAAQAEFDAWLNETSAHEVAFLRLEAAWSRTERLAALRSPKSETAGVMNFLTLPIFFSCRSGTRCNRDRRHRGGKILSAAPAGPDLHHSDRRP